MCPPSFWRAFGAVPQGSSIERVGFKYFAESFSEAPAVEQDGPIARNSVPELPVQPMIAPSSSAIAQVGGP